MPIGHPPGADLPREGGGLLRTADDGWHHLTAVSAEGRLRIDREEGAYRRLHAARPAGLLVPAVRRDPRTGALAIATVHAGPGEMRGMDGLVVAEVAVALGRAVAALRTVPPDGWPVQEPPWVLSVHHPSAAALWHAPAAVATLVRTVQADGRLCATLDGLRDAWEPTAVCHGDVRLANVVVAGPLGRRIAALIDWEDSGRGDKRWDTAGACAALIADAVGRRPVAAWAAPAVVRVGDGRLPAGLSRRCRALWTHACTPADAGALVAPVAAHLVRYAFEEALAGAPSPRGRTCLDLAQALVGDPEAATRLLGVPAYALPVRQEWDRGRPDSVPPPAAATSRSTRPAVVAPLAPSTAADPAVVAALAAAVTLRPPDGLWWCGRPVPVPPVDGDDPLLGAAVLVATLTRLLYENAHLAGGVQPLRDEPDDASGAGAVGEDPAFVQAVRAANRCPGTRDAGWRVVDADADRVHLIRDDLRAWVAHADLPADTPANGFATLTMPAERRHALPGWIVLTGPRDVAGADPTDRTYAHVSPSGAAAVVAALTHRLCAADVAYRLKAPAHPAGCDRADAVVLYTPPAARPVVMAAVGAAAAECPAALRPRVPLFSRRIAPGLAMAPAVAGEVSHGWTCCRRLALDLVRAAYRRAASGDAWAL